MKKFILLILIFLFACTPKVYKVEDSKMIKQQYLCIGDFPEYDIYKLQKDFTKAGFELQKSYSEGEFYLVLTKEMIEFVKPNGKGILKKRHIKHLKNEI